MKNGFFGFSPKGLLFWGLVITTAVMFYHHDMRGVVIFGALSLAALLFA